MKSKINKEGKLIISENGFTTRLWGILMFVFTSFVFFVFLNEHDKKIPTMAVILTSFFWIAGLTIALFVKYKMQYEFDKEADTAVIITPELMGFSRSETIFKLSDIQYIERQISNEYSETVGRVYGNNAFSFVLKTKKIVYSNYSSSDSKEIDTIIDKISEYCGVEIKQ